MRKARTLDECVNIFDLRDCARRRLPSPIFHFMEGGAESEWTARRNTEAFDDLQLIPRCLVDVSTVRTATCLLGQEVEWPLVCAPTGASRLFHTEGELAVARAAAKSGALYSLATASTCSLEEVAAASNGPKMFEVYVYKDRNTTAELIARCKQAGYRALCLMVDVPALGKRERDLRTGFNVWPKLSSRALLSMALHPAWAVGQLRKGPVRMANLVGRSSADGGIDELDPAVTWKDIRGFAEQWGGPFALKGVMSADDARRAADEGVSAVMVSNHGGRQLDGTAAAIDVLPDISRAVGDRLEIILDGGVRRGVHILKALAAGAKACSIGRPYLYGLSAGGEKGVAKALQILRAEFVLALQLSGCANLECIDERLLLAMNASGGFRAGGLRPLAND